MNQRPGQSILEMVIAIGVIITSVLATTSLIISTITAGRISQNRVEAANFAREGIEIVRQLRDTNYLRRDQNIIDNDGNGATLDYPVEWDDSGLITDGYLAVDCSTVGGPSTYTIDRVTSGPAAGSFNLNGTRCAAAVPPPNQQIIKLMVETAGLNRFFAQNILCPAGYDCTNTRYSRTIAIAKFSGSALPDVDLGEVPDPDVGRLEYMDVTSSVTWRDRTGLKTLEARERLYNWR